MYLKLIVLIIPIIFISVLIYFFISYLLIFLIWYFILTTAGIFLRKPIITWLYSCGYYISYIYAYIHNTYMSHGGVFDLDCNWSYQYLKFNNNNYLYPYTTYSKYYILNIQFIILNVVNMTSLLSSINPNMPHKSYFDAVQNFNLHTFYSRK